MISFKCPHCEHAYNVQDEFAGRNVTCRGCKKSLTIPGAAAPKPAAPPKPTPPAAAPKPAPPAPPKSAPAAAAPPKPTPPAPPSAPPAPRPAAATMKPTPKAAPGGSTAVTAAPKPAPAPAAQTPPPTQETKVEDRPPPAPAERPTSAADVLARQALTFTCTWCDEQIQAPNTMAGKQMPCPLCKRIVKVPELVKQEKLDWRAAPKKGPSLAKRDEEKLDGAWGAETISTVSVESLEEAGALPEKREPMTWGRRIKLAIYLVVIVGLVGTAGFLGYRSYMHREADRNLARALEYLDPRAKKAPLAPLAAAGVHRAAGEFALRADDRATAIKELQDARGSLSLAPSSPDRDAAVIELVQLFTDLVPDPKYIERSVQKKDAKNVIEHSMKDVASTMMLLQEPAARAEALRRATRTLIAKNRAGFAATLATQTAGEAQAEMLALVGLELWRAKSPEAGDIADQALRALGSLEAPVIEPPPAPPDGENKEPDAPKPAPVPPKDNGPVPAPPPLASAPPLVALWVALDRPLKDLDPWKSRGSSDEFRQEWLVGRAEGLARAGNADEARALRKNQKPLVQWRIQALIAVAGLEQDLPSGLTDADAALQDVKKNPKLISPPEASWLMLRLVRLTAQAGKADLAAQLAQALPDAKFRGVARLELLRVYLERSKDTRLAAVRNAVEGNPEASGGEVNTLLDEWFKDGGTLLTYGPQLLLMTARHDARYVGADPVLKVIDGWTPEQVRALGYAGVALGLQDREK